MICKKIIATAALLLATSHGAVLAADLNVAAALASVPFEFEDAEGKVVGFEVDLVNLIAGRLGKSVEFAMMPFGNLFAAVQSSRADIAIGTITITPKRLESVSFSQPIMDSNTCLTVASNSNIQTFEDLAGKQVAVMTGSVGEIWSNAHRARYRFGNIRGYDSTNEPMLDLLSGRIDGLLQDCPIVRYYVKGKPQYTVVADIPSGEALGLMFAKNSPLLEPVNAIISTLKQEGELGRLHEKWFGGPAPQNSSTVTIKPIPGR